MTRRDRPRLNITLDSDLKARLQSLADRMNISVSRLIEEVMLEFLDLYQDDPMVGARVKKSILDRKKQKSSPAESAEDKQAKAEIKEILDALEATESEAEN